MDTSYSTIKIKKLVEEKTGSPFGFLERIKMGGIGSKRVKVVAASEDCLNYLRLNHYEANANFELRKNGAILHFRNRLQEYSWLISYEGLKIKEGDVLHVSDGEKWMELERDPELDAFLTKLGKQLS